MDNNKYYLLNLYSSVKIKQWWHIFEALYNNNLKIKKFVERVLIEACCEFFLTHYCSLSSISYSGINLCDSFAFVNYWKDWIKLENNYKYCCVISVLKNFDNWKCCTREWKFAEPGLALGEGLPSHASSLGQWWHCPLRCQPWAGVSNNRPGPALVVAQSWPV
jgi:hypothetical protein